jgi:hypothetical protein
MKTDKNKQLFIEQLKTVPIIQITCQKTSISRTTYYRWRDKDKDFREKSDVALKEGISFVNDMAESQLISAIKEGNMTGIIFWLKNRHQNYDTTKLQISSSAVDKNEPLTPEQQEIVKKALQMATILPFEKEENNEITE